MRNKRVLVLGIALLILTAMVAGVAFAEEQQEYEWKVTVSYKKTNGTIGQETYYIWAVSSRDAEAKAQAKCEYEKAANVISCGAPIATGQKKGN
jgi:hypothetical protein